MEEIFRLNILRRGIGLKCHKTCKNFKNFVKLSQFICLNASFFLFCILVSLHLEAYIRSVSHNATITTFYSLGLPLVLSSCLLDSRVDGECNRVAISVITNSIFFFLLFSTVLIWWKAPLL